MASKKTHLKAHKAGEDANSTYDRWLKRVKDNPLVAALLIIGLGVVVLSQFKAAITSLVGPGGQDSVSVLPPSLDSSGFHTQKSFRLAVFSQPEGAEVTIDGRFAGVTNCSIPLVAGQYHLELRRSGYKVYKDLVLIPQQGIISTILEKQ